MSEQFIDDYAVAHTTEEDNILYEINREAHLNMVKPIMLSGHYQGKILEFFSSMIRPTRILEIGTYTAYSAICLAKFLQKNGKLITIEINNELERTIKENIKKAGLSDKIEVLIEDAKEVIPKLKEDFDLIYIDADKKNNQWYYDNVLPKLKTGGHIIIDNALWYGKVCEEELIKHDKNTEVIHAFNNYVHHDSRVENVLLPVRDGLLIARKL